MADLHFGRLLETGDITVYYHVPVPKDIASAVASAYEGTVLMAPGATDAEKMAAARGELREVVRTYNVREAELKETSAAVEHIRRTWNELVSKEQGRLAREFSFYGKSMERL